MLGTFGAEATGISPGISWPTNWDLQLGESIFKKYISSSVSDRGPHGSVLVLVGYIQEGKMTHDNSIEVLY
jgi:hypothetical protein